MLSAAMLRLLPIQVLMLAVASLNSLISGWFAANYVGDSGDGTGCSVPEYSRPEYTYYQDMR